MVVPLLKWAGGKRWLTAGGRLPVPRAFGRYVEPFLGSAAVFFFIEPQSSVLSDLNPELINLYQVLRDSPSELRSMMVRHQEFHSDTYYYSVRAERSGTALDRAARFLYLNRTCWNGLYRVNKKGEFNVPIGSKQAVLMESDDFEAAAELLSGADLRCSDFEPVIDECVAGDFLFVDPPYTAKHNMNGFVKYNEKMFSWEDQVRLYRSLVRAKSRGVKICVTNADHDSLHDLYREFDRATLSRQSVLAGHAAARGATTEAVFTANIEV